VALGFSTLKAAPPSDLDVIHHAARHQIEADRIDHQLHPIGFGHGVVRLDAFGQAIAILEARTAAALHRKAQDGRLGLPLGDPRHAGGRRRAEGDGGEGAVHKHVGARPPTRKTGARPAIQNCQAAERRQAIWI
jgi:hypothetical protein